MLDDLAEVTDALLDARAMPVAAKLALAALRDIRASSDVAATMARWANWIRLAARDEPDGSALRTLVRYILFARPAVDVRTLAMAMKAIEPRGEETIMTTARELMDQGEAIGMAKGRADTLLKQLRLRFGVLPAATVERVTTADAAKLDRWVERVLTAATLEETLAD